MNVEKYTNMLIKYANANQKKASISMLISDRKDFKARKVTRDKEGIT